MLRSGTCESRYPEAAEEAQADRRGDGRVDREERVVNDALDLDQYYHISCAPGGTWSWRPVLGLGDRAGTRHRVGLLVTY